MTVLTHVTRGRARLALTALLLAGCVSTPGPAPFPGPPRPPAQSSGPQIIPQPTPLQCVPFARDVSGVRIFGDAHTWWDQAAGRYRRSADPAVGAVMAMGPAGGSSGHVAVVRRLVSARVIEVDHANWLNQGEVTLAVPVQDVSAAGDWSAVRVWHIPGDQWGARAYPVYGFIHPLADGPQRAVGAALKLDFPVESGGESSRRAR